MAADSRAIDAELPVVASNSVFVATFAALLVIVAVLLAVDLALARIDRNDARAHAAAEYAAGVTRLAQGEPQRAVESFAAAASIDRTNVSYALGLAHAELAAGDPERAEALLRDLLARAENDGAVNLAMAHVVMQLRRPDEAQAFFHRAIFGRWGPDSIARRTAARVELIDMLERMGQQRQLLAELLPLEDTPADSVSLRRRLGHLFIAAGSPRRAADIFRDLLRRDPRDGDAYAGMGDAALGLGNFRTARADFVEAARLRPEDPAVAARLALADTVLAFDPAARRIDDAERYRRAYALLERANVSAAACGVRSAEAAPPLIAIPTDADADGLLDRARRLMEARPPACGRRGADPVLDALLPQLDR